jgi:hypothetical protein
MSLEKKIWIVIIALIIGFVAAFPTIRGTHWYAKRNGANQAYENADPTPIFFIVGGRDI